ncbi:transmembrane amino acid transporter [Nitzschia inconspicua]|uniref:Transmembrane amino acid transporter n=1 Tax=Nitzschia inconspicua TaxID=303405 RepID=A0A9K3L3C3_9STRA|nr:transmembrane amino acid transporter [Nitzschia inconspicua]
METKGKKSDRQEPLRDYGSTTNRNARSNVATHMQTYTAGEDSSRLAEMAREFGLEHQRKPRNQVRERVNIPLNRLRTFLVDRILDPEFANIRMRSVYTSHHGAFDFDQESEELMGRPPSWLEDRLDDEVGGERVGQEDPHAQGLGGDLPSAVLGIIKGMVGPAILYLPHGFANAGWAVAIPILILCTMLFLSSAACLLDSWKLERTKAAEANALVRKKAKRVILSYPELAYRALGAPGEATVKIGIALMQSGVCLTYLIFVPQNLKTVTKILLGYDINASYFMTVMLLFQIPMSWIRDIRKLTITNLLANVLILYGLVTCLCFAFANAVKSDTGRRALEEIVYKFTNLDAFKSEWFLFIGTSVLLFEGSITLLVPLQEAVYREEDRERFPEVYKRVIFGIISFYTFFGIVCWMCFGDDVKTVMTTSLPEGNLAATVQLAYSIAVIFTFPLQNFPSLEIATMSISSSMKATCGRCTSWLQYRNVIASALVCLLAVVAVATMESLDKVVSLMGSLLGCPLAFVFPPLIHNSLDDNLNAGRRRFNWIIAGLGFCAMVLASFTTLLKW